MNLETSLDTWNAFQSILLGNALVPLERNLSQSSTLLAVAPWPAGEGQMVVPNTTWSWSVITADPERQIYTSALLAYLTEPAFLGAWTHALHLIPPTPSALAVWPDDAGTAKVNRILPYLASAPGPAEQLVLGPIVASAVAQVINEGIDANLAAQQAMEALPTP